jgi:HEAT repeat protein
MPQPVDIPFKSLLEALSDTETPINARYLYRLSDLEPDELDQLARTWDLLPAWRRRGLMEDLEEMGARDTLLSFEALAEFALKDPAPEVRLPAVRTLWEFDTPSLVTPLLRLLEKDESLEVRAAAATGLGRFVYLGEVEQISPDRLRRIEEALLKITRGQEPENLQQRALESLGYSSRDEVPELIRTAYRSTDPTWTAAALKAMGRSANERWSKMVVSKLEDTFPVVRTEAARAAGELEIKLARQQLLDLLEDPDWDVRKASIWSLSQIGGEGVRTTLERMFAAAADEAEADHIETALDNLAFTEDMQLYDLLDIAEDGAEADDDLFEDEDDQA